MKIESKKIFFLLRPEEYLLLIVLGVFKILELLGVTKVFFKTAFISAAWDLSQVFISIYVCVASYRGFQELRGRSTQLPSWVVACIVAFPITIGGLFAAAISPFRWNRDWLLYGYILAGSVLFVLMVSISILKAQRVRLRELLRPSLSFLSRVGTDLFEFARGWLPFIVLLTAYENSLYLVVRINPNLYDPVMFELDEYLFGGHPDIWFEKIISPKVTEIFAFFYDSLYLYPVIVGMTLFLQRRMKEFRRFLLAFVLAGYIGFIGYIFVPVIGPAFYYSGIYEIDLGTGMSVNRFEKKAPDERDEDSKMAFYLLSQKISGRDAYGGEIPRNCFPSLHTAWGVIVLIFSFMYLRKLFYIFFIPILLLIGATSYLRWHYAVDVLAGAFLAWFMAVVIPWFDNLWEYLRTGIRQRYQASQTKRMINALGVALLPAFVTFVAIYSLYSDSESQRSALVKQLGEKFVSHDKPNIPEEWLLNADFEGKFELLGIETDTREFLPGKLIELTLWWYCKEPSDGDWRVFTHLKDHQGRMLQNLDHHPIFGTYPLRLWAKGDVVRDIIFFKVPPSSFSIWVGIFSESDVMKRLSVVGNTTHLDNAIEVLRVER